MQFGQYQDIVGLTDIDIDNSLSNVYNGYTVLDESDKPIACIGLREMDSDNAFSWALMSSDIGVRFFDIHKKVKEFLDSCCYRYIWCDVREGFEEGHRWVKLLGFNECLREEDYYKDGGTAIVYKRELK